MVPVAVAVNNAELCVCGRYGTKIISRSSMVWEIGDAPGAAGWVEVRFVERWVVTVW